MSITVDKMTFQCLFVIYPRPDSEKRVPIDGIAIEDPIPSPHSSAHRSDFSFGKRRLGVGIPIPDDAAILKISRVCFKRNLIENGSINQCNKDQMLVVPWRSFISARPDVKDR
jgi:hypothetical protein